MWHWEFPGVQFKRYVVQQFGGGVLCVQCVQGENHRCGGVPGRRQILQKCCHHGDFAGLARVCRCARTTGFWCVAADNRCGARPLPSRAPRTVSPSIATASRSPLGEPGWWATVQVATAASKSTASTLVASRRIVASLGAITAPLSRSGAAPNDSSSWGPAGAASHHRGAGRGPSSAPAPDCPPLARTSPPRTPR